MLARMDRGFVGLNLVYLAFIALLPFPTDLLGNYFENPISITVYATNVAIISGMEVVLFRKAYRADLLTALDARGCLSLGCDRRVVAGGHLHALDPRRLPEHDGRGGSVVPERSGRRAPSPPRAHRDAGIPPLVTRAMSQEN